jgi:hypothetical protein
MLTALAICHGAVASPPEEIPAYVDWAFELPAPEDKEAFFETVKQYQSEVDSEMPWHIRIYAWSLRTNLKENLGLDRVTIVYDYYTEQPSGEWQDHEGEVHVTNEGGVTIGDILYSLHHHTNQRLSDQGIMAIEGFELLGKRGRNGGPTYYVYFGD